MPIDAKPMPNFTIDDMLRLVERCEIDDNNCWIISGAKPNDYGRFKKDHIGYQAHRAAYAMFKGEVPTDKAVDHQCPNKPNRACVNPQHLAIVTHKQNRRNADPNCSKGHPYSRPNVYEINGRRRCVACELEKLARVIKRSLSTMAIGRCCPNGHYLTFETTYTYTKGGYTTVLCAICHKEKTNAAYQAKQFPLLDSQDQRRFWSYVDRSSDGCWPWTGHTKAGYGQFGLDKKHHSAHRIALQLEHGKIDRSFHVDHLCNNPTCCRPDHLEAVDGAENQRRKKERSGRNPKIQKPKRYYSRRPTLKKVVDTPEVVTPPGYATVQQLAACRGFTAKKVHRWIERRGLPSIKRNNLRYVKISEFDRWIESRPEIAGTLGGSQMELFQS